MGGVVCDQKMKMMIVTMLLLCCCVGVMSHSEYIPALLRSITRPHHQMTKHIAEPTLAQITILTDKTSTNAEAYWNSQDNLISFQSIRGIFEETHPCDLIYTMHPDGSNITLRSPARGRTTCSYLLNDGQHLIYSSTMSQGYEGCPPIPDPAAGYFWPLYKDMDIYKTNLAVSPNEAEVLFASDAYDAESTLSPDGNSIVFTSAKDGDLELYIMDTDGQNVQRMTYSPGYDGGAFFSHSGKMIGWRAVRPQREDLTYSMQLLRLGLVEPVALQLYVQDIANPMSARQVAQLNGTNFAPFFLPDDSGLIFSSNMGDPMGGSFQIYTINLDGSGLQQITFNGNFNSFPMFSYDGKYLLWASDREAKQMGQIAIFKALWKGPGGTY